VNIRSGEQHTAEYLKINPQHKVPALDDNGFYLADSHAITTYLISKYATDDSLYPRDVQCRAIVDQRLHFDTGILFPPLEDAMVSIIYYGAHELKDSTVQAIDAAYSLLETFLEGHQYLAGDSLTVADLACITSVTQIEVVRSIDEKYVNVLTWIKRLELLPYYDELNAAPLAELRHWIKAKLIENQGTKRE